MWPLCMLVHAPQAKYEFRACRVTLKFRGGSRVQVSHLASVKRRIKALPQERLEKYSYTFRGNEERTCFFHAHFHGRCDGKSGRQKFMYRAVQGCSSWDLNKFLNEVWKSSLFLLSNAKCWGVLIFFWLAGKIIVAVGAKSRSNNFGPLASLTTVGS